MLTKIWIKLGGPFFSESVFQEFLEFFGFNEFSLNKFYKSINSFRKQL